MIKPVLDTIFTRRKSISEERLKICKTCEHFRERGAKCEKCGCFMEYKTMLMSVSCPINKWGPEKEDNQNV